MFWICFGEILPLIIYGAVSMMEGGTRGFGWMVLQGYIQWLMILCPVMALLQAGLGVLLVKLS